MWDLSQRLTTETNFFPYNYHYSTKLYYAITAKVTAVSSLIPLADNMAKYYGLLCVCACVCAHMNAFMFIHVYTEFIWL